MLLPELLSKVQELEMVAEHPLMVDVFPGVLGDVRLQSNRLTGRRHKAEITQKLEAIERRQARWIKNSLHT